MKPAIAGHKCVFSGNQIRVFSCIQIYVFSGLQRVEELEKDHAGPQQNKHHPTFCLQGIVIFIFNLIDELH